MSATDRAARERERCAQRASHWLSQDVCRCGKTRNNVEHDEPRDRLRDPYHRWNPNVPFHTFERPSR